MKKSSILPLIIIFVFLISGCGEKSDYLAFEAMNTFMTIKSFGPNAKLVNQKIEERIRQIEKDISTTDSESQVYKINESSSFPVPVYGDTEKLIEFALKIAGETKGALNPCLYPVIREWGFTTRDYKVPQDKVLYSLLMNTDFRKITLSQSQLFMEKGMMLDFGALGKGYAADEAIRILKENGITSAILDFGGNIQVLGGKTGSDGKITDWTIGIKNPEDGAPLLGVKVQDMAVVTSGGYERFFIGEDGHKYIHIFDDKTGRPVESDVASVTIITKSGLYADALSTALFVMGKEKALSYWNEKRDFNFIMVFEDGEILDSRML